MTYKIIFMTSRQRASRPASGLRDGRLYAQGGAEVLRFI